MHQIQIQTLEDIALWIAADRPEPRHPQRLLSRAIDHVSLHADAWRTEVAQARTLLYACRNLVAAERWLQEVVDVVEAPRRRQMPLA